MFFLRLINEKKKIELKPFVPNFVLCGSQGNEYPLKVDEKEDNLFLSYVTDGGNNSKNNYSYSIPKFVIRDKETFEVLGLLQAEMGKTYNGCLVFANSEYKLVNKVLRWFKREFDLDYNIWRWYIRVNLVESNDENFRNDLKKSLKEYWLKNTELISEMAHPKTVCYVKETNNKVLQNYGTIMIEYKSNLFSQVIKKYVKDMTFNMLNCSDEEIRAFMRGIIAGESCIEIEDKTMKYRVHISVSKLEEKQVYFECLKKLNIDSNKYPGDKLVISKRKNNIKLLEQQLMTLSPSKYAKFRYMMLKYPGIKNETDYFKEKCNCIKPNKISEDKVEQIINLSKEGLGSRDIAEKLGLHILKVQRVRQANSLGKRLVLTSKDLQEKIIEWHYRFPFFKANEIAAILKTTEGRIWKVRKKYSLKLVIPCRVKVHYDVILREIGKPMRELDDKWLSERFKKGENLFTARCFRKSWIYY